MIRASINNVEVTLTGIADYGVRTKALAFEGIVEGLKVAETASRKLISATDHSLAMLALMGHPYAAAHPDPPHDDQVIHAQSGEYLAALTVKPPIGVNDAILEGRITIGEPLTQLDGWLQEGTSRMIARPWMAEVMHKFGPDIQALILAHIAAGEELDATG